MLESFPRTGLSADMNLLHGQPGLACQDPEPLESSMGPRVSIRTPQDSTGGRGTVIHN